MGGVCDLALHDGATQPMARPALCVMAEIQAASEAKLVGIAHVSFARDMSSWAFSSSYILSLYLSVSVLAKGGIADVTRGGR